jgi:hypothetical protein
MAEGNVEENQVDDTAMLLHKFFYSLLVCY